MIIGLTEINDKMNTKKIILDLCGGTGSWSKPYLIAGYDVRVITLPDYNVLDYTPPENVYGILAAPPCTEFSIAKGSRPRDLEYAMRVVEACMRIIWKCRLQGGLKFWAMENPRGLLRQFLGVPSYTFEQWQFGEKKIKATDIWGYFNRPKPIVKIKPAGLTVVWPNGRVNGRDWSKVECPAEYAAYISQFHGDDKRAALRAITPAGFALKFFQANL